MALGIPVPGAATWQNRLIASRRFQRWAAGFPLTRGLVRRDGERLFDLMAGFVYSQTLSACIELGVLQRVRDRALQPHEFASQLELDPDRMAALLQAAAALDLLQRQRGGAYRLGRTGALVLSVPGIAALVRHHAQFYRDLADPVALLRGDGETELASFWPYSKDRDIEPGAAAAYSELMAETQSTVAEEVLRALRLGDVGHLMDVGGGTGAFLQAVARAYPRMRLSLLDLPAVTEAAAARLALAGIAGRITLLPIDFRCDPLPPGADAISLVRVLYDHSDAFVAGLLARAATALPRGGRIVIAEPMAGEPPSRFGDAYFGLYTLAMRSGRLRSPDRVAQLLSGAGFGELRFPRTLRPFITQMVIGRMPA